MKGYFIGVKNDLLEPKHRKKIGSAVWEFMWLIDKTTSISEEGIGTVLGGRPIKLDELCKELGVSRSAISENLNKLEKEKYINIIKAPYGLFITVNKSSKVFGKTKKYQDSEMAKPRSEKQTEDSEKTKRTIYNTSTIQDTIQLPLWLNKNAWENWIKYNKEKKKKMPPTTIQFQLKKLEKFKNDHIEMINQSIEKGWSGLFPVKKEYSNSDFKRVVEKRRESAQEIEERRIAVGDDEARKKLVKDMEKLGNKMANTL